MTTTLRENIERAEEELVAAKFKTVKIYCEGISDQFKTMNFYSKSAHRKAEQLMIASKSYIKTLKQIQGD